MAPAARGPDSASRRELPVQSLAPSPRLPPARSRAYPLVLVDQSLIAAFRHRDPNAVRDVYREYGRLVYAVAHRALGRADLAEEATQETFVRAWQAADRLDPDRDPAPWL